LAARTGPPRAGDLDLLVNATPIGMRPDDPLPWPVETLREGTIVGDVTTKPEITPFLAAARERGLAVQAGRDMVEGQLEALFRFFGSDGDPLGGPRSIRRPWRSPPRRWARSGISGARSTRSAATTSAGSPPGGTRWRRPARRRRRG